MKSILKKGMSVVLSIVMLISTISMSFAGTETQISEDVSITVLNSNAMLITEGNNKTMVTTQKNGEVMTVKGVDLQTGQDFYFIRDEEKGTLYSSITGYTGEIAATDENTAVTMTSTTYPKYEYIRYSTMAKYVSAACTAAEVASYIAAYFGRELLSMVISVIQGFLDLLHQDLKAKSYSSGLKVTIVQRTITKHQGSRVITVKVERISDVSRTNKIPQGV